MVIKTDRIILKGYGQRNRPKSNKLTLQRKQNQSDTQ